MTVELSETMNPDKFKSKHWLHCRSADGFEMIQISGVCIVDFQGQPGGAWRREQLDMHMSVPHGIIPSGKALQIVHWVPFITLNAVFDQDHSVNGGFAVDEFWGPGALTTPGAFALHAALAVRDRDAYLFRVGFQVTLLGHFVDYDIPPIE